MIKEILLSTLLSCAIGIGAIPIDPYTDRAIQTNSYISNDDLISGYTTSFNNYSITCSDSYETSANYTNYLNTSDVSNVNGLTYSCAFTYQSRQTWYENTKITDDEIDFSIDDNPYYSAPIFQIAYSANSSANYLNIWVQLDNYGDVRFAIYKNFTTSTPLNCYLSYTLITTMGILNNRQLTRLSGNYDYYYFADFDTIQYYVVNFTILDDASYQVAIDSAYQNGYFNGRDEGYRTGYLVGKDEGLHEHMDNDLVSLFLTIADTPIMMLRSMFDFNVLGISIFVLLAGLITILVGVFVIKKLI